MLTFDRYRINMVEKACVRLLSQFDDSVNGIQKFVNALVQQTQSLNDIELTVLFDRVLDNAAGVQLDIIGRIVGINRPSQDGEDILYFQWDATEPQYWDAEGGWYVTNASTSGFDLVGDDEYRRFIVGKILKNQVTGGTLPELLLFNKVVFAVDSGIIPVIGEVMAIDIVVANTIDPKYIPIMESKVSNVNVENEYFLPIPAGVRLNLPITILPP